MDCSYLAIFLSIFVHYQFFFCLFPPLLCRLVFSFSFGQHVREGSLVLQGNKQTWADMTSSEKIIP